jgi:hypothetical protein
MPAGDDATRPVPVPLLVTERYGGEGRTNDELAVKGDPTYEESMV